MCKEENMDMMLPKIEAEYGVENAREIMESILPPDDGKMFVLTNSTKLNGAVELLNPKEMDEVMDKLGEDFFILPSSIHETIIVPKSAGMDFSELENMVQEINATQVEPEEHEQKVEQKHARDEKKA